MSNVVGISGLAGEIAKQLAEYSDEVAEKLDIGVDISAKELVEELKTTSPVKKGKGGGSYRKGWKIKVAFNGKGNKRVIVHNKTDYQLTHLLEYGHQKSNGGRVDAKPHIKPAEENAVEKFVKLVEEAVK